MNPEPRAYALITPGDADGIGPWVMAQALHACAAMAPDVQRILCGPPELWRSVGIAESHHSKFATIADHSSSPAGGAQAALFALEQVRERLVAHGKNKNPVPMGVCTGPISKERMRAIGFEYPGHTEYMAEIGHQMTGTVPEYCMFFYGSRLRVALATIHEPLRKVPEQINQQRLLGLFRLITRSCRQIGIPDEPSLWVAGLNPHAGEHGLIGNEDDAVILPAIQQAQEEGIHIRGPFAPDTMFYTALDEQPDVCIAMYHDQGLIPFKLQHFHDGVNCTLGLPFLRTSPDHGTAFDLVASQDPQTLLQQGTINTESATQALALLLRSLL